MDLWLLSVNVVAILAGMGIILVCFKAKRRMHATAGLLSIAGAISSLVLALWWPLMLGVMLAAIFLFLGVGGWVERK